MNEWILFITKRIKQIPVLVSQAKNEQIFALDGYSRIQHPIALLYLIGHSLGVSFFIKITRRLFRIEKA